MSELIVREADDEDGSALQALARDVFADHPGVTFGSSGEPSLDRPATSFEETGGRLWVVMRDAEAVGALGVFRRGLAGEFDVALIGLDKDSRGQGIATALLAGAEAFAEASGGETLGVWVDARLEDAVAFLERHGFVREPGLKGRQDGSDAIEIRFTRRIASAPQIVDSVSPQPSEALRAGDA